jgi:hypothetical protein
MNCSAGKLSNPAVAPQYRHPARKRKATIVEMEILDLRTVFNASNDRAMVAVNGKKVSSRGMPCTRRAF